MSVGNQAMGASSLIVVYFLSTTVVSSLSLAQLKQKYCYAKGTRRFDKRSNRCICKSNFGQPSAIIQHRLKAENNPSWKNDCSRRKCQGLERHPIKSGTDYRELFQ